MGECVREKSADAVETRWRDTDVEGESRSLYLPLLSTSLQKRLRAPILAVSYHHVPGETKLSLYLAAWRTPLYPLILAVWVITCTLIGRMSGVVISLQISGVRETLYF